MTLLSGVRDGVTKAADALANTVSKGADAVADVIETAGNASGDGLGWLADRTPGVGGVLRWLGGILAAATDLIGSAVKGVGALVGGILAGAITVVGALVTLDPAMFLEGLRSAIFGLVGALLLVLGKAVAFVQVVFGIGRPRSLNEAERTLIAPVFHRSIATYNVRVVDGKAGVFSLNDRPFVLGNVIYMKGRAVPQASKLFVHECVHVWQNQHVGARYTAEALASQFWGAGYDWEREANAGKDWERFEREAQAELVADVYALGSVRAGRRGNGVFFAEPDETQRSFHFNRVDRTALANAATKVPQACNPWRLSSWIAGAHGSNSSGDGSTTRSG